jgi:hypothetical protein
MSEEGYPVDPARHQFFDQARHAVQAALRAAALEYEVAPLRITVLCETPNSGATNGLLSPGGARALSNPTR